jgi:hypothetical protein
VNGGRHGGAHASRRPQTRADRWLEVFEPPSTFSCGSTPAHRPENSGNRINRRRSPTSRWPMASVWSSAVTGGTRARPACGPCADDAVRR